MCGYIRRATDNPGVADMLAQIGLGHLADRFSGGPEMEHYYPAFGGDPRRQIHQLIIAGQGGPTTVDATWWFDCQADGDTLKVGKRTTFNARNLDSPYWKVALRHHRGLVVATGLGESKKIDGSKHQYLMEGERPFLMGALYRPFDNGCYSCAVITRDSHPRFDKYHDKAFPCFIPSDPAFVDTWLNATGEVPGELAHYLHAPKITEGLWVSEVKTFKRANTSQAATWLEVDS